MEGPTPKANRDKEQIVSEDPWQFHLTRQNRQKDWAEGVRRPTEPDIARRSYARDAVHERDFPVEPGEFTDKGPRCPPGIAQEGPRRAPARGS